MEDDHSRLFFALAASARGWKGRPIRIHPGSWLEKHVLDCVSVVDIDGSGNMASGVFVLEATIDDMIPTHAVVKVAVKKISKLFIRQGRMRTRQTMLRCDSLFHEKS